MRIPFLLAALCGLLLASPRADAQLRFLPYVGYTTNAGYDISDDFNDADVSGGFLVGVGAEFGLTPGILPIGLSIRPSVETVFIGGETLEEAGTTYEFSQNAFQASLDAIGSFSPPLAPVGIYAGVGVTYVNYSAEETETFGNDVDTDETDGAGIGVNLLAGARFGGGFIQPFVQGRYSIVNPTPDDITSDDLQLGNAFSVQAGVSIGL